MIIGYQGIPGSYSEEVIIKNLGSNYETDPMSDFENVFQKVFNNKIDYAMIPIENSLGGSLHVNYDLLLKYDLKIIAEYNLPINHCLLVHPDSNFEDIKYITSHPQALVQCTEFIDKHNFKSQDFFDTAGSARFIRDNCKKNIGAIASKRSAEIYGLKILSENIQNKSINYTRFLLLSKGDKTIVNNYIATKTSIAFSLDNSPGALANALSLFSNNKIDLTKIESRPNRLVNNKNLPFQYLFYLDFIGNENLANCKDVLKTLKQNATYFNILGSYPSISEKKNAKQKLKIGIIGFGRFGRFLAKELSQQHWIWAYSRSDYSDISEEYGTCFVKSKDDFISLNLDVIIIATSISSFENIISQYPDSFFDNKLVIDVLSVKKYPKNILLGLNSNCDLLCTHPMFGPDSAKKSWKDLPFVYEKVRISNIDRCNIIIDFFTNKECKILEMNAEEHDRLAANSQFITHLTGRILNELNIESTPINTLGFDYLLEIMDNTCNDSLDLFQGLYQNNSKSIEILNQFEKAIKTVKEKLVNNYNLEEKNFKIISESGTSELQRKINKLKSSGKKIYDYSIGEPDFDVYPNIVNTINNTLNTTRIGYTNTEGLLDLRFEIAKYLHNSKGLTYETNEILCTNGSKQAIYQTLLYLCDNNSQVIIPTPYWTSYPKMVELVGAKPVYLKTSIDNSYDINIDDLKKLINSNTRALILCNPSNPTGIIYNLGTLEQIADLVLKHKFFVISDEVYEMIDYYKGHISFAKLNKMKEYTFTINGFSKGFGMTGYRLGYVASTKDHIKNMTSIQSQITSCSSLLSQKCGIDALNHYTHYQKCVEELKSIAEYIYNGLINIPNLKVCMPMGAIYIFVDISFYLKKLNITDIQFCTKLLESESIAIVPGSIFGDSNSIRVCYGVDKKKANKLIDSLNNFLGNTNNVNLIF
jgi:exosome complex component RRP43